MPTLCRSKETRSGRRPWSDCADHLGDEVWLEDAIALAWERRGLVEIIGGEVFRQRENARNLRDNYRAKEPVVEAVEEPPATRAVKRTRKSRKSRTVED